MCGLTVGLPAVRQVHGANPGLISHFVKQALLNVAHDTGVTEAPGYVRVGSGSASVGGDAVPSNR